MPELLNITGIAALILKILSKLFISNLSGTLKLVLRPSETLGWVGAK